MPITICGNNQGSLFISSNSVQEKQTKYIDIHYYYIHECIENDKVSIIFVPGTDNPADMLKKNLDWVKFEKFHEHLGLTFGPIKKCLTGA